MRDTQKVASTDALESLIEACSAEAFKENLIKYIETNGLTNNQDQVIRSIATQTVNLGENMNIDKHPILRKAYDLSLAIEAIPCSETTHNRELTEASIRASELCDDIEKLIDETAALRAMKGI